MKNLCKKSYNYKIKNNLKYNVTQNKNKYNRNNKKSK